MRIHDFLYCAEGKWEIFIDNKPYILNKDDILILHAGVEHYGKEPCLPETKVYFIHIFPEDGDSYSEKSHNNSSPNLVVCDPLIHCQNFPEIKRLFKEIIQTYWSSLPQSACKCSVLIQMLLIRLSECEQKHSFDKEIALTESCINIISQSSHFFLKPKEMAKSLFVSERTLRNAFKKVYNTTPYHYQRDMKLKRSIALMKEYPELTMNEIAINLGFADESHFCKVFIKSLISMKMKFRTLFSVPYRKMMWYGLLINLNGKIHNKKLWTKKYKIHSHISHLNSNIQSQYSLLTSQSHIQTTTLKMRRFIQVIPQQITSIQFCLLPDTKIPHLADVKWI